MVTKVIGLSEKKHTRCIFLLSLFVFTTIFLFCLKTTTSHVVYEPVYTVLVDDSRVENDKVRHVFREVFLEELVKCNRNMIIIYDCDTLNNNDPAHQKLKYFVSFDIMDYSNDNTESESYKLLVTAKVIEKQDRIVKNSLVESAHGSSLQSVCERAASKLAVSVAHQLISLRIVSLFQDTVAAPDSM